MKPTPQAHSQVEEMVAERYRQAGYEVILQPSSTMIPFDLGGYRPDLIARKGALNLIIEVKSVSTQISYERLRDVVEEIRRHKGWRFLLVTERDIAGGELPTDSDQFSWEEIDEGIRNADKLRTIGEHEAAYVLLWIAFERTIRKLSIKAGLPVDRLAPEIMIRQLYSEGELSMEQFDAALSCLEIRHRVVHGFRTADLSLGYKRLRKVLAETLSERR
jgi:hypothetical protein